MKILTIELLNQITWLKSLAEGLSTLNEGSFDYSKYVSKYDEDGCGTVCCAYGWIPKFSPESGLEWIQRDILMQVSQEPEELFIELKGKHLDFMFFGYDLGRLKHELSEEDYYSKYGRIMDKEGNYIFDISISQVIERINYVIKVYIGKYESEKVQSY